jgi:hypothetical protein
MGTNLMGEIVANNGTYYMNSGDYQGNVDQVIVRGTGILGIVLYITDVEGGSIDVTDIYLSSGSSTPLPDGVRITPQNNDVFTRVEIFDTEGGQCGLELVLA